MREVGLTEDSVIQNCLATEVWLAIGIVQLVPCLITLLNITNVTLLTILLFVNMPNKETLGLLDAIKVCIGKYLESMHAVFYGAGTARTLAKSQAEKCLAHYLINSSRRKVVQP